MSSSHNCSIADADDRRYCPYGVVPRGMRVRLETMLGDPPQSAPLRSMRSSSTPTEVIPETDEDEEHLGQHETSDSESVFTDGPPLGSDPDLPTILQILLGEEA